MISIGRCWVWIADQRLWRLRCSILWMLPAFAAMTNSAAASPAVHVMPFSKNELRAHAVVLKGKSPRDEIWAYIYEPPVAGKDTPLVLILPILGAPNLWIEEQFAVAMAQRGMASAILFFPQQFHRRSFLEVTSGFLFLGRSTATLAGNFTQSVADVESFLDWLAGPGQEYFAGTFDVKRTAILGTSLGSLIGSVVMAHDKRIKAGVFLLSGSDPAWIVSQGSLTKKMARKLGIGYEDLLGPLAPFDLSRQEVDWGGRPVLLVDAIWDTIIPKVSRKKLKSAIPHAKVISVPAGHYTSLLHMFWIKGSAAKFLAENLQ